MKKNKNHIAAEFLKQNSRPHTTSEYREFLFSKVKQCNNFRPTLALQTYNYLSDIIPKGSPQAILDFSAGWGDRLFAACIGDKKYIGLDPNTNNTHIYDAIIKNHGKPDMQKVIATGAEYISIPDLKIHMTSLGIKQFDLIFTSPPYFDYEIYADTAQSISNYSAASPTGFDKWLTYFLLNVIMRYTPLLRDNGYIGIYIQDADNNNYLEPIGLFALAFAEQLGLTVCGIISSTRYPFIVLQKVGSHKVLPYKNPDNGKVFSKAHITGLFKKNYPVIYSLCERLFKLNNTGLLTPVLTSNAPMIYHQKNIIKRAFEKVFMQLDLIIDTVYIDAAFFTKPMPYSIQAFKRILDHFKIRLLSYTVGSKILLLPFSHAKHVKREQKEEVHPNATSKVSLSNLSSRNGKEEVYDNLRLGGTPQKKKEMNHPHSKSTCIYLAIKPITEKLNIPIVAFEPILHNTIEEWLLLNKKSPDTINTDDLDGLILIK